LPESLESEIQTLRALFRSKRDPEGLGFAPLADALRRQGSFEEALALVQEGLQRWPDLATGHLVAARTHWDVGDSAAAQASLERLFKLDDANVEGLRLAAGLAESWGDRERARALLQSVLKRDPGAPDVEDLRARSDRLQVPVVALEESPPDPSPLEELPPEDDLVFSPFSDPEPSGGLNPSERLDREARVEEPIRGAKREAGSVALPAAPPLVTRTMAELYVRQGLIEKAIQVYEQLLVRHPDHPEWKDRLIALGRTLPPDPPSAIATRSIHTELNDLLAWEPDAVPIATLAPSRGPSAPGEKS